MFKYVIHFVIDGVVSIQIYWNANEKNNIDDVNIIVNDSYSKAKYLQKATLNYITIQCRIK